MESTPEKLSRRDTMKQMGLIGSAAALGSWTARPAAADASDFRAAIRRQVEETPLVDTHEHLIEEEVRLQGNHSRIRSNDWALLFSHYLDSDLLTAGMPRAQLDAFFAKDTDPLKKWDLLEPWWPAVRHTGYGQAVEIAMRRIYGVDGLSRDSIRTIQEQYVKTIRPGFYQHLLGHIANIESCQVNFLEAPFSESRQPTLLMQDISIIGMHMGPNLDAYASKAGITVKSLADWHAVIDWWFEHYGPYAVAVKSQAAYSRNIDFDDVPAEEAEGPFQKRLNNDPLSPGEKKRLEDHLFWYSARKATEHHLPVKLHTGYYAGQNGMPLDRVEKNPAAAAALCRLSPETQFVFMHIGYPYYEALISVAKHYTNAHIDMCWAWIISPVAGVNFLKQYLVTAPANKVLTFGGDYIPVEPVIGHAAIARQGIAQALIQLVEEGWLSTGAALDLVEPIQRGNARRIFNLEKKTEALRQAPWL
ncbi:MAG: amidohydrolase family protein [bacterium]